MLQQLACQRLGAAQLTLRALLEYLAFVLPASHQRRPPLLSAQQLPSLSPKFCACRLQQSCIPGAQGRTDL